ncbi:MAG: 4-alpha-glucanotransferase [Chitinophagaceae bacterium]|jgi:4-alpha-glucanotransferase|nr:4-alpha-glucanotransferase [Chitinophagaceae bacterium]OQY93671.1 MAG: 4-alpha-glucanotransferase [Sphingobacteriales bacterium UTBCD1]
MKLQFYLRFHTEYGQSLWISGNLEELGNGDPLMALPMEYLNDEFWQCILNIKRKSITEPVLYKYFLKNKEGEVIWEWGHDRQINVVKKGIHEVQLVDTWNHTGEYENVFFTAPFKNVFLKKRSTVRGIKAAPKNFTHLFRVKAPLLKKNETICLVGSSLSLGEWITESPVLLSLKDDWYETRLDLSADSFPVAYKYGVYDLKKKEFTGYESGNNRLLYGDASGNKINILHDGFVHIPNDTWKGAGVAIPVFSLRSRKSFGVGEFTDIKLLADWASKSGLKLIQLLPVNDTTATHTAFDSYPYAAISAFALHPIYINIFSLAGKKHPAILQKLKKQRTELNKLPAVDHEQVMKLKHSALKDLYEVMGEETLQSDDFKKFFENNSHWLVSYAAFCFLRDKYGTASFIQWNSHKEYHKKEIEKLCSHKSPAYKDIAFYYFIQFHLHCQLEETVAYTHKKGIALKGDLPIGVSRNSCEAWMAPEIFDRKGQVGAPPDDFTAKGQNWEFPAYNWKRMKETGFDWWKQRFTQMSYYFDAFRIDHILGFFRIWYIPSHSVEGIMGHFVPAIPVGISEFGENGIWFDPDRYLKPFINDHVLAEIFGDLAGKVKTGFLKMNDSGGYELLPEFDTQRKAELFFIGKEESEENKILKQGLYDLISNVLLFEEEGSQGQRFHFRIGMEKNLSFKNLIPFEQERLHNLYINYFYRRQDDFWSREAMHKLPQLKEATNMLMCGEDLGMVPHCVPDVMNRLGILSLEIQRMPKDPGTEFFNPEYAHYLSVVTPSTHDMSTIRGWWEENREKTQRFFNNMLGQVGDAPFYCEAWVNRAIVLQNLYSPAMWSIFLLQDILGMSDTLRRQDPNEERINVPADNRHLWTYRMHLNLEDLVAAKEFYEELRGYVIHSGRG